MNHSKTKMGKVLSPSLFLLMLVFSYSVKSQITAKLNAQKMMSQLDEAVSSMKVKSAEYQQKLPTPERILNGLKGWQDAFDMNVNYQLKKIGVPSRLQEMGFEEAAVKIGLGMYKYTYDHFFQDHLLFIPFCLDSCILSLPGDINNNKINYSNNFRKLQKVFKAF